MTTAKKAGTCTAWQANKHAPDFSCRLGDGGHSVHIAPNGTRWGDKPPHGCKRKSDK